MKKAHTEKEQEIADALVKAWALFCELDSTHTCHVSDFADGIHKCQDVLIHRIVQRDYPDEFPTYKKEEGAIFIEAPGNGI